MTASNKSSATSNLKPMNFFYVWYTELCRRSNTSPLSIVKPAKPKNDTVLDFTADRIKPEEWTTILNALRLDTSLHVIGIRSRITGCKFFYDVDTEDRVKRMKRRCASLWTDYILRSLITSLGNSLKTSQVLSSLELDGLPLSGEYFEQLLQSLRKNRSIKMLSFKRSPINDCGCQQLCLNLRAMPNVEVLNLSSCSLTSISGQHIARIIKHQQINRYCQSWHNSLRYEEPEPGIMAGLKRVTLNNNPGLGDEGLSYILEQLVDDLWIKAIDMQHCNVTENMSGRLIDYVACSRCLEVADFRNNEHLGDGTVERILEVLEKRQRFGNDPEYEWCMTTSTLYDFCNFESSRTNLTGVSTVIQKSKSAPLRQMESLSKSSMKPPLRRTKTLALIDSRKSRTNATTKDKFDDSDPQLSQLKLRLQEEIMRRRETERKNNELQKKLNEIRRLGSLHTSTNLEKDKEKPVKVIRNADNSNSSSNNNNGARSAIKDGLSKKKAKEKPKCNASSKSQPVNGLKQHPPKQNPKSQRAASPEKKNVKEEFDVQKLFEKLLCSNKDILNGEDIGDVNKIDDVLDYYYDSEYDANDTQPPFIGSDNKEETSQSNVSLERFLEELNDFEDLQLGNGNGAGPLPNKNVGSSAVPISDGAAGNAGRHRKLMVKVK